MQAVTADVLTVVPALVGLAGVILVLGVANFRPSVYEAIRHHPLRTACAAVAVALIAALAIPMGRNAAVDVGIDRPSAPMTIGSYCGHIHPASAFGTTWIPATRVPRAWVGRGFNSVDVSGVIHRTSSSSATFSAGGVTIAMRRTPHPYFQTADCEIQ